MSNNENFYFNCTFVISCIFIIFTNNFYNFENSIVYGAADGITYMKIAQAAPYISSEELIYHKAERFIIPYFIGLISYLTKIESYTIFRVCTFIFIFFNLFLFFKIFKKLNIDINKKFYLFSLFIFNPYIFRYFLSLPTLINDLIFIFSGTLLIFAFLENKKILVYLAICIATAARVNAIFFIITIIITKLVYKKKFNLNNYDIILIIIIFFFTNIINSNHANMVGVENFAYDFKIRFGLFFSNFSSKEFLLFIIYPIINFLPLILVPLLFNFKFDYDNLVNDQIFFMCVLISLMIYFIAFIAGPIITGKNIIRLINLSYPFIIYIIFKLVDNQSFFVSNIKKLIFFLFMILWSSHPTYSIINFLILF